MNNDNLTKTAHKKIFIDRIKSISFDDVDSKIDKLLLIAKIDNKNKIIEILREIVPTYS